MTDITLTPAQELHDSLAFKTYTARTFIVGEVNAFWGARLIAPSDLLHDRQDLKANSDDDKQALIAWLNGVPAGKGAISKMQENLRGDLGYRMGEDTNAYVLYEDDQGIIVGSRQQSYGYVYVSGWLKA